VLLQQLVLFGTVQYSTVLLQQLVLLGTVQYMQHIATAEFGIHLLGQANTHLLCRIQLFCTIVTP